MPNAALSQKLTPSPKLADILGSSQPLSRADAVKELWDYFKKHNLQDPKNRRNHQRKQPNAADEYTLLCVHPTGLHRLTSVTGIPCKLLPSSRKFRGSNR